MPLHILLRVRKSRDKRFPGQWIDRGGAIPWPSRSPDVTPFDFFFWGCVKDRVLIFNTPVRDVEELKQKITDVVATVNLNMLANTWCELRRRLEFSKTIMADMAKFTNALQLDSVLMSYFMEILF